MSREREEIENYFQSLLEESFMILNRGDKVTGTVCAITATEIQVELGCKYPGYIFLSGLGDAPDVRIGEEINAYVVQVNDRDCMVELSMRPSTNTKNISNRDIRKICDVVREEVLTEVRDNLSQMKPELISSIVDMVVRKVDNHYSSQIEKLEKRISEMERIIGRIGVTTK